MEGFVSYPFGMTQEDSGARKRPLSRSERVRNYLIGVGAASALILGLIAQFKGEPVARQTWETLRITTNKQAERINRLQTRMVYFQAWQEARTAMDLQQKLDKLQHKYDALLANKKVTSTPAKPTATAAAPKSPDCKEGLVLGADNKCHKVRKAVAAQVKTAVKQVKETKRRLHEETRRRLAAERTKRELMRKLKSQSQQSTSDLPMLPKKLEDATRKK